MKIKITRFRIFSALIIAVMVTVSIWTYVLAVTISDTFTSEAKIGKGTTIVNIDTSGHTVTLPACYTASTAWNFVVTTTVRNIAGAYNDTVQKDIYCDNSNCVLWTYSATHDDPAIPDTVCIASNANVYGNILWSASDSGGAAWASGSALSTSISGGDLLGQMPSPLGVGTGNTTVSGASILTRYYTSASATFPAMKNCKDKGPGWRLPTILELDSIRDQAKGSAPYSRLPSMIASDYWSSTEGSATNPFYLYFGNGFVSTYNAKSNAYYVRCVRGY